jgi:parallel beta-helix repeat protein
MPEPIAFLSYTSFDDAYEEGRIAEFCERLSAEVRMRTGHPFPIFRDKKDIKWGQNWRSRVEQGLDEAVFLIPILTPSYFQSQPCCEEYERFREREKKLGRNDLILPVYYVECDELEDPAIRESNQWAEDLSERQYEDWRNLRWEPWTSPTIGRAFERLAKQIKQALKATPPQVTSRVTADLATAESVPALARAMQESKAPRVQRKEPPTHIVDAMWRGDFTTISEAIAAAQPGDRILVRPGYYREGLILDKPLEIIGDGNVGDIVVEAKGSNVILFKANMGIVRNLTLRQAGDGDWYAVDIGQGRLVLEDCGIISQSLACVAVHSGADPQIRRNRIHTGNKNGVFVYENGLGTIEENDIFGNARAGVEIMEGGNPTVRRNRIHDGKGVGVFVHQNGLGTIEENDIFGNASAGVAVREGGNPTVRRNRIHDGRRNGVLVYKDGLGVIEDNDIFANAYAGMEVREGGNPTVLNNRINKNVYEALWVHAKGSGTFEDNDLRDNARGAWKIESGCEVKSARNQE